MRFYRGRGYGYRDVRFGNEDKEANGNINKIMFALSAAIPRFEQAWETYQKASKALDKGDYSAAYTLSLAAKDKIKAGKRYIIDVQTRIEQTPNLLEKLF